MKIENPNMTKIRKAADTYEKEANSNKVRSDTSKAYQVRNQSNKEIICYVCGNKGHKSGECSLKMVSSAATANARATSRRHAS